MCTQSFVALHCVEKALGIFRELIITTTTTATRRTTTVAFWDPPSGSKYHTMTYQVQWQLQEGCGELDPGHLNVGQQSACHTVPQSCRVCAWSTGLDLYARTLHDSPAAEWRWHSQTRHPAVCSIITTTAISQLTTQLTVQWIRELTAEKQVNVYPSNLQSLRHDVMNFQIMYMDKTVTFSEIWNYRWLQPSHK